VERPHTRSIGVNDFIRWREEGSLVLSPKFQRRRVWPVKAKAFLIDTILRGLPIPKIYMRQHLDLRGSKTIHEVVDGQQRLGAVLDFRSDALRLSEDNPDFPGAKFSSLTRDAQKAFLTYEFTVDLLIDAADADVLDIFARINSHSVPLNAQEKRNAKFFGSFKSTVYTLGFQHLEFWKRHRILSDAAVARMKEAELTSELLVAMAAGLQDKKKSLDTYYKKWDDRFPYQQKSVDRFQDIIDLLNTQVGDYLGNSNFRRPALFYSLFLALYEIRYGQLAKLTSTKAAFGDKEGRKLRAALAKLNDYLEMEQPPREYQAFVTASQRQTDNITPRRTRHTAIIQEFRAA
jgi:uncharacterized protein with ParB-like and HNH nuclease domain